MTLFDLPYRKKRIEELTLLTQSDSFWSNQNHSRKVIAELNMHKKLTETYYNISSKVNNLIEALTSADPGDFEFMQLLEEEYTETVKEFSDFEIKTLLTGPYDGNNVILEFHPGAGGTESQDWAGMLFNMYIRWAENKKYKVEILDYQTGEEAGIKSASMLISGENAYGYLKGENGVHRLVRISPFDANKRRHTSFASVEVTPEITESEDISINDEDLKIDTYRSSGAGGQHINKTDSAVRITHLPTGIVVACQNQRSQIQNKEKCLLMLTSKLQALYYKEKQEKLNQLKGIMKANEWGSQIRSYVLCPYTLVKDNRSNVENTNAMSVLNGDLDDFIFGYLKLNLSKENDQ